MYDLVVMSGSHKINILSYCAKTGTDSHYQHNTAFTAQEMVAVIHLGHIYPNYWLKVCSHLTSFSPFY